MTEQHFPALRVVWLLAAAVCLLAVLPLPYGFYSLLRVIVTAAALAAVWYFVPRQGGGYVRFGLAIMLAALFNPVFPVHLTREIWFPIDLAAAAYFAFVALSKPPLPR